MGYVLVVASKTLQAYKDLLKVNMKLCGMAPEDLEALTLNRSEWLTRCKNAVLQFEANRVSTLKTKRTLRTAGTSQITIDFTCDVCG